MFADEIVSCGENKFRDGGTDKKTGNKTGSGRAEVVEVLLWE